MKNLILTAASAILLTSCSQDIFVDNNNVPTEYLTFNVEIPTMDDIRTRDDSNSTKTFGDGSSVYQLRYYIYGVDNKLNDEPILSDDLAIVNSNSKRGASLNIQLPSDFDYEVVFLATACDQTNPDSKIYYNPISRQLNVNYNKVASNDESLDCFYGVIESVSSDKYNYNITLKRPFAQLNIGDRGISSNSDIKEAGVIVNGVYTSMNIMDGSLTGEPMDVTLSPSALPTDYSFPVENVDYLTMNYLLVNEQKEVNITLVTISDEEVSISADFYEIPLKRNCQTNIYGNLFNIDASNDFIVELNPEFSYSAIFKDLDNPSYDDYDLVLQYTFPNNKIPSNIKNLKLGFFIYNEDDKIIRFVDLLPYIDSNLKVKVTWEELNIDSEYRISFTPSIYLTNVVKFDFNKINIKSFKSLFRQNTGLNKIDEIDKWDTSNIVNMDSTFSFCSGFTELDLSSLDTSNVRSMRFMFHRSQNITSLDVSNFNNGKVEDMFGMFSSMSSLTSINLYSFKTSNVKNMSHMFDNCRVLKTLDLSSFDTSNVTTMNAMFQSNSKLESLDLSSFDTSNVTDMAYMFNLCSELKSLNLGSFDTSNVTTMNAMFQSNTKLESLDLSSFDTSNVTNMAYMFSSVGTQETMTKLDISSFNVEKVEDMSGMFGAASIENVDFSSFHTSAVKNLSKMFMTSNVLCDMPNFKTPFAENMQYMFDNYRREYISIPNLITSNVTDMYCAFDFSQSSVCPIEIINILNLDFNNVSDLSKIFLSPTLTDINVTFSNINNSIDLSYLYRINNKTALNFIKALNECTDGNTIIFYRTVYADLSEEQIELATNKGWTVVSN